MDWHLCSSFLVLLTAQSTLEYSPKIHATFLLYTYVFYLPHIYEQFRIAKYPEIHVFGLCEEGSQGKPTQAREEQTSHRKSPTGREI